MSFLCNPDRDLSKLHKKDRDLSKLHKKDIYDLKLAELTKKEAVLITSKRASASPAVCVKK